MSWVKKVENDPKDRSTTWGKEERTTPGDVTSLVACRGKVTTYDDDDVIAVFSGSDDGFIAMYNSYLCFEKDWKAHKEGGVVNCLAAGEDENGTTWLYSASAFGEIKQWWPAALELLYQKSVETPGSESKGFTSAGGRIDSAVKQLLWRKGYLYTGDDAGQLCKFDSGLNLEWFKNTYADIASLAVGGQDEENLFVFTANQIQSQVIIGDLRPRKTSDNSLVISNMVSGKSPVAVDDSAILLITGDLMDHSVLIWKRVSAHGWEMKHKLLGHEDTVSCAAINPDSTLAATGSWDGNTIIWDIAKGEKIASVQCGEYVNCLCWGPDGEIYVGGKGGSVVKIIKED